MDGGCDIVQGAVIKTIPKKKKCKKAKWFSEKALQIAEKRREVKGKGEKKRHTHLNTEFLIDSPEPYSTSLLAIYSCEKKRSKKKRRKGKI